jgi:hypothetical protein
MQLAQTRFVKIDGTEVQVAVNSAAEARTALKELKHKKKELNYLRKMLLKQQRKARARPRSAASSKSFIWSIFDRGKKLVQAITAVLGVFRPQRPVSNAQDIDRELVKIEEIQHSIDSCVLQVEGKLISHG